MRGGLHSGLMGPERRATVTQDIGLIAGVDVGDKHSQVCIVDKENADVVEESRIRTTKAGLERYFGSRPSMRVAIETGTHSPWISRLLEECGHEVLVANAREVASHRGSRRKNDRIDAEQLARLARHDPKLLKPIKHRGRQAQADLVVLRSRDALVRCRTRLVNHVRGMVKSFGARLPSCDTDAFHKRVPEHVPEELKLALDPLIQQVEQLTEQIKAFEARIMKLAKETYPETELLTPIYGVGVITAMTFVLTLDDPHRFRRSRTVGAYLGLTPGQWQSGERDPGRRITKDGDEDLRKLLVQCAHTILREDGEDSDLRRHGLKIMQRGGVKPKQRAAVAVARKLGVLLHHLLVTGEVYEPLYNAKYAERALQAS